MPLRAAERSSGPVQVAPLPHLPALRASQEAYEEHIKSHNSYRLTPELADKIKAIYADPAVVKVREEEKDLDLEDNAL